MKIAVTGTDHLRICGYSGHESLKETLFFLDPNVTDAGPGYVPSSKVIPLLERKYAGDECTILSGLPAGDHVLSLVCGPHRRPCSVSHLVLFE